MAAAVKGTDIFHAVGSCHVLYAQSHHHDQYTNLCCSPRATMSWKRLTSPCRVNRKMNPNGCLGGGYKQWLLTQLHSLLTHTVGRFVKCCCLFEIIFFAEIKNNNESKNLLINSVAGDCSFCDRFRLLPLWGFFLWYTFQSVNWSHTNLISELILTLCPQSQCAFRALEWHTVVFVCQGCNLHWSNWYFELM